MVPILPRDGVRAWSTCTKDKRQYYFRSHNLGTSPPQLTSHRRLPTSLLRGDTKNGYNGY